MLICPTGILIKLGAEVDFPLRYRKQFALALHGVVVDHVVRGVVAVAVPSIDYIRIFFFFIVVYKTVKKIFYTFISGRVRTILSF